MYQESYIIMWALMVVAFVIFGKGVYDRYRLWKLGAPDPDRLKDPVGSFLRFLKNTIGHLRLLHETYPGIMHALMFWAFAVCVVGTLSVAVTEDLNIPLFYGWYYLILSLALDIFGLLAIVGMGMALYRRYICKADGLDNKPEDMYGLILLLAIFVTGFILEGLRIELLGDPWVAWNPVGAATGKLFAGASAEALRSMHRVFWWVHMLLSFGFIAYIPYSKFFHLITGPMNQFLAKDKAARTLVRIDMEDETIEQFGVAAVEQFTWKQLLDGDACLRCGRCENNCPAHLTGKPLSPKKLTQDLKANLDKKGPLSQPLVPEVVSEEEIWACTTCGSCEEQCPVFVEHVGKVIDMRRNLVLMESNFPHEAKATFQGMERHGNPWNIVRSQAEWVSKDLGVQTLKENPDAEYLYYPGCSGLFDDRNQKVTTAVVKLLQKAGISFAVLGAEQTCCGDSSRRLGNEYLYQMLAVQNVELFTGYGVKKIISSCPHCYNTLKNEYPQFGGSYEVLHHSELLAQLVSAGKLQTKQSAPVSCTYHDSCYLGRYNDVYAQPRSVLKAIPGLECSEMDRNHAKAFCCGAGGGRMWLEENTGKRINVERTEQALATGASLIVTACPYCLTMMEDGTKTKEMDEKVKTRDVAEVLWENIQ